MNTTRLQGLTALVVDDYVNICHLVELILETQGIKSTCVTSAKEALEVYPSLHPDIVISDIEMPGEDGFSLIQKIRSLTPEEGGQIPAVVLTGLPVEEVKPKAMKAGFQGLIGKPVEVHQLLAVITEVLQLSI